MELSSAVDTDCELTPRSPQLGTSQSATPLQGLCGVFPEEHAELYVQQFTRCEPMIYADMEEE
jgi:hypothetical protein